MSEGGMNVDVAADEAEAFTATKRTGRRNAVPSQELSHALTQISQDLLPDLAKQLSLTDDPMDAGKPCDSSQPSTSGSQTSQQPPNG
ncbi:uncharacterized protein LOC129586160 isoform X2 [Paramacrobiotus metropolitanus]|nr:uncharacterized protein LOC129586160 isoform X2 [Paramacrobiotus metropolitanus]XP_055335203.1 uncharacterized protein LOC129586160 isoform X2 [Paramacrobiotus metropolitanus]XP_055335210.1 uncharacterized protein LOC129586160 isoform X2 [Paramacrobiotus metropolitanus]XP_055335219.1 uncharacterized protein LOC129586160 isoform X2 [Paramacrobiotus metropolitanus]